MSLWSDSDDDENHTTSRKGQPAKKVEFDNLHMQSNQERKRYKIRDYVDMK